MIVIMVNLPMTKTDFLANQDIYIVSVAKTAGTNPENVKILSVEEVSARSLKIISARLLLATFVRVKTSVLISASQQNNIKDQSLLNSNLNKNGLPSGILVIQYTSVLDATTPAPALEGSGSSGLQHRPISCFLFGPRAQHVLCESWCGASWQWLWCAWHAPPGHTGTLLVRAVATASACLCPVRV